MTPLVLICLHSDEATSRAYKWVSTVALAPSAAKSEMGSSYFNPRHIPWLPPPKIYSSFPSNERGGELGDEHGGEQEYKGETSRTPAHRPWRRARSARLNPTPHPGICQGAYQNDMCWRALKKVRNLCLA